MLEFVVEHEELDLLLFNFLQELIYLKDARRLLLRIASVSIDSGAAGFRLCARAMGEELNPEKHNLIVDVKAVTLYRFLLQQMRMAGWRPLFSISRSFSVLADIRDFVFFVSPL